jgi:hypothetical protein
MHMTTIKVENLNDGTFRVTLAGQTTTEHRVTVSPAYHEKLTAGRVTAEELVKASFEFLLQREPNTSILRSFDLPVIGQYFPEYEKSLQGRFG